MIDYDYLEWGAGISPEEIQKKADYKELSDMDFFRTESKEVSYEEKATDKDDYNVWYFENKEQQWDTEESRQARREQVEKEILQFSDSMEPGKECWEWRGGTFLDTFLLDCVSLETKTKYDTVLLLAPAEGATCPVAIIWEMIPESRRTMLRNLQKSGEKIFAAFSERFKYPDEGMVCLEIYVKK